MTTKREEGSDLNYKSQAEDGCVFLSNTTISLVGDYYGFTVGGDGAVISAIDYDKYSGLYSGNITTIPLIAGSYYPIKFKTITLTSGALIL